MKPNMKATNFLKELAGAALQGQPLFAFANNQDGFAAALENSPDALEDWLHGLPTVGVGTVAEVRASAFASVGLSRGGAIVVTDKRLDQLSLDPLVIGGLIKETSASGQPAVGLIDDGTGLPMAVAIASAKITQTWPLQREVVRALQTGDAQFALIAFSPQARDWLIAARAYGLTPAETRLISALAKTSDLKIACANLGISYETGRKVVASSLRKTGATRQPELLRQAMTLTAGALRSPHETDDLFADLFSLRRRQAQIARLIARGLTREHAASAIGISQAVAKDELRAVFTAVGVTSALGLARVFGEVEALHGLAAACDVTLHRGLASPDPIRLVPRRGRAGGIAVADHGPPGGRPVGRAQSPGLLAALRQAGWRAIAIERPGYGLTDAAGPDPWLEAARDVKDVLDELAITKAAILARGGARPALSAATYCKDRILGGVLIGPDPPLHLDTALKGVTGQTKAWMFRNPRVIRSLATLMSNFTSSAAISRLMRRSVERSPVDIAVLEDPRELEAMVRGGCQAAMGMTGFASEMEAWAENRVPDSGLPQHAWTILFGKEDSLFRPEDCATWWQEILPNCTFDIVPDGGRLLVSSHPHLVIDALEHVWLAR
jgi:pimeloyl-ACP methyl ester carboxylesterase/DNA-binding CsgD family transcriptional regulator